MRPHSLETLCEALASKTPRASSDYDLNPEVKLPDGRVLRPAAVLIGVVEEDVVLTKRASHLKHHPGQIAFPGGKLDPGDPNAEAAALREANEEIGLNPKRVDICATLEPHETVTGYSVTPVLARIHLPYAPIPEEGEVAEVFRVPLNFVLDPANFRVERRRWRGQWRQFYVVPYGPYYIWGATARMLRSLADQVTS